MKQVFTMAPKVSPQLKGILKANPDYQVRYALDEEGNERRVQPKSNIDQLMAQMGLRKNLRGVGFTRASHAQSKRNRKIAKASRRKNRRS